MKASLDILTGELERLFSASGLNELCHDYFDIDPKKIEIFDESKAVYVRRFVDWCEKEHSIEALADAVLILKKGMVDPRIKKIYKERFANGIDKDEEIAGFQILEEICADDLGVQFACKAIDANDDNQYVLWAINGEWTTNFSDVQRFLVLMRTLKTSKNEFLQKNKAVGCFADGRPYIVFSKIHGQSIASEAIAPIEALKIIEAVIDAVEVIHDQGIVHSDLRRENIMIEQLEDESQKVVLFGLGSSRLLGNNGLISSSSFVRAISPEIARGDAPSASSDVYALGCLLFEMIAGKPVFSGRKTLDVVVAHLTQKVPSLGTVTDEPIPESLDAFVAKLMSKEVSGRPRTLNDVRKQLADIQRDTEDVAAKAAQSGTRADIETWAEALTESPEDAEILDELLAEAKLYNAWGAAIEVLEETAILVDDNEVGKKLLFVAVNLSIKYTKDYEKAEQLLIQIAEDSPDDIEIEKSQMNLFKAQGKFEKVIEKLGAKAENTEEPTAKNIIIREMAYIFENNLKDPSKAFDYYIACLSGTDEDLDIVKKLEKLAERSDRYQDLATAVGSAAQVSEESGNQQLTEIFYGKMGSWYLEKLDQANYALSCFQKVLEFQPSDEIALDAIADLYRGAQQWVELAGVLVRRGESEQVPSKSRKFLAEAAGIYYEKLSETENAKELLQGVLKEDPADIEAGKLLVTIYESSGNWEELSALLVAACDGMPEGLAQVESRFKLGEIYEVRLDNIAAALEQYEKSFAIDSRHFDSIKGLERIYARNDNFAALRDNLEIQLEIAVTPKQRIVLLERLADIYEEEVKDVEKAITCFTKIVEIDESNLASIISLTRHFRKLNRHEELVDILEKRAQICDDIEEKSEYLSERAEIIRDELNDAERAAEAFRDIASAGGVGGNVLDALVKSQIDISDYEAAQSTFDKMFDVAESDESKISILQRLADLQLRKMDNAVEAASTLRRAKEISPADKGIIALLAKVFIAQGNYSSALDSLEEELEIEEGTHLRAAVFSKMGIIALENIGDEDKAMSFFERALELDDSNFVAGDNISTLYRKRNQWEKALPIYERWIVSVDALEPEKQIELFSQTGEAYVRVGRKDDALDCFKKASELANEPPLMLRLGDIACELGEFSLAKEQLARYAEAIGDQITAEQKVTLFVKQGAACLGAGDVDDAAKLARQATVMAPDNNDARLLLANVHEKRGDFRGVVEARQKVIATMDSDDERWIDLIRATAIILFEKLRDANGAAEILNEVLIVDPDNRDILGELLKIYYATKNYGKVVDVVLKIADLVDDSKTLSRYYLTVAKIYRREMKQPEDAVCYFEKALENDPELEDARKALFDVMSETKDWDGLEKYYKRAIAGLKNDATVAAKITVFGDYADLLITKLDKPRDGILLAETILKLDSGNTVWLEKLSELYADDMDNTAKAIELHYQLLEKNPVRVDSLRMLYRIHSAYEDSDKTWCAASLLALLNQANPEERKFYRDNQPEQLPSMSNSLKDLEWNRLLSHKSMNQNISKIFSVLGEAIGKEQAQQLTDFGLKRGDAIDAAKNTTEFLKFFNSGIGSLGIGELPAIFYNKGQGSGFKLINTYPSVLVVGKDAKGMKDKLGMAFCMGQQLTLQRPGLFVSQIVRSGTQQSAWLLAAIKLFVPALPVPSELAGAVHEKLTPIRDGLDSNAFEKLQGYVQSFVSQAADVNLKRWTKSISYTGDRAGLLLCGDISIAIRVLKEQITSQKLLAERLHELTLFTVSEEHHKLREYLGTAIKSK